MRTNNILFLFSLLILFSCKEIKINKGTNTLEIVNVIDDNQDVPDMPYDKVIHAIGLRNSNPYMIEIDSSNTIKISPALLQRLEELGLINNREEQNRDAVILELPIPIEFSQETLYKIQGHNYNSSLRMKSSYTFSKPYSLGANKIAIFGDTSFAKGNNEWVCLFEKIDGNWQLSTTSTLIEN